MPKCINCLKLYTKTSKSYNGNEPSPKGYGICGACEQENKIMRGIDNNMWQNIHRGKSTSWVKCGTKSTSCKQTDIPASKSVKKRVAKAVLKGGAVLPDTALLIIDVQHDFCEGLVPASAPNPRIGCVSDFQLKQKGSLAVSGTNISTQAGRAFFTAIQELQQLPFTVQVATMDHHPCDHVSFASNNGADPFSVKTIEYTTPSMEKKTFTQVMWPNHCVQESMGSKLVPQVDATRIDKVFYKGTHKLFDSYSGFGDGITLPGNKKIYEDTGLLKYLKDLNIKHVVVCGIATDYCVKATCLDAVAYGFQVTLVDNACRGVDPMSSSQALAEMAEHGVVIAQKYD